MREDCRHYQSRTYSSGETARWCARDLAPEAPWRCPDDCPGFERRIGDAGFTVGALATTEPPPEPDAPGVAELLDQAEDIVNLAGPEVLADWEKQRERADSGFFRRLFKRRPR